MKLRQSWSPAYRWPLLQRLRSASSSLVCHLKLVWLYIEVLALLLILLFIRYRENEPDDSWLGEI